MDDFLEKKKEPPVKGGVYNPDSGAPPPQDIDGGSVKTPSKPKKMAGGGYVKAADGCAIRGKTRGRMI